jgi:hypothetical protein
MLAPCLHGGIGVVLRLLAVWPKRSGARARREQIVHPFDIPAEQLDRRHTGSSDRFAD